MTTSCIQQSKRICTGCSRPHPQQVLEENAIGRVNLETCFDRFLPDMEFEDGAFTSGKSLVNVISPNGRHEQKIAQEAPQAIK